METPQPPSQGIAFPGAAEGGEEACSLHHPVNPPNGPGPVGHFRPTAPPHPTQPYRGCQEVLHRGCQEVQARIRVGISRLSQGPSHCSGNLVSLESWRAPRTPEPSEHGTFPPLLRDPATGIHVHLQHLQHPLVTTGTFNELIQGQLACTRGRRDGHRGNGRNGVGVRGEAFSPGVRLHLVHR